jgi:hypothetical protein
METSGHHPYPYRACSSFAGGAFRTPPIAFANGSIPTRSRTAPRRQARADSRTGHRRLVPQNRKPAGLSWPHERQRICRIIRRSSVSSRASTSLTRYPRHKLDCMRRTLRARIHNPRDRVCGCDPDCWCRRTALGRVVRWWFPGRFFGLPHKNRALEQWKRAREQP